MQRAEILKLILRQVKQITSDIDEPYSLEVACGWFVQLCYDLNVQVRDTSTFTSQEIRDELHKLIDCIS